MKTAIVGVGAIGGMIGTCLAASGATQVSALARGETLAALRGITPAELAAACQENVKVVLGA